MSNTTVTCHVSDLKSVIQTARVVEPRASLGVGYSSQKNELAKTILAV